MKQKLTRRQVQAWLTPIRACFRQIRNEGEVMTARGYAVTRLHHKDEYVRTDYCIAGFRGLLNRLFPDVDDSPLLTLEKKLANGVLLTVAEIDHAFAFLKDCEDRMIGLPRQMIRDAVLTEQISVEMEMLGLKEAA